MIKQVTLNKVNRLKDKSVSIQFITNLEQTPEELMEMDRLLDTQGALYFSKQAISQEQVEEIDKVSLKPLEGKSASQRLRSVIYVYYKAQPCSVKGSVIYLTFDEFYKSSMERLIQQVKNKLD